MTGDKENFQTFEDFSIPVPVHVVGKATIHAYGKGEIALQSTIDRSTHLITNVWYVPEIQESILSGFNTRFNNLKTGIDDDENFVLTSKIPGSTFTATMEYINRMAFLPTVKTLKRTNRALTIATSNDATTRPPPKPPPSPSPSMSTSKKERLMKDCADGLVIHDRLFHPSKEKLRQLGIKFNGNCESCVLGKQHRTPFLASISNKTELPLLKVSSDLCGPIKPISFGNAKYILTFLDLATGYSWIYTIENKQSNTVLALFKCWLAMVERQSGYKLKFFHTDGGKEYTGKTVKNTFTTFLHDTGIVHDSTPAYSSASNGAAERLNRTLLDMARPSIIKAKLPTPFWAEAVTTANKIRNRLPSKSSSKSPHEHWFGKKPGLNHRRRFGCIAFHRIPTKVITEGEKIDPRSVKCCLLGYISNHIYRLWNPERQKLIISRNVIFHEDEFLPLSAFNKITNPEEQLTTPFDNEILEDDILDDEVPNLDDFTKPKRPISTPPPISTSPSTPTSNPFSILTDNSDSNDESDIKFDGDHSDDNPKSTTPMTPVAPAAPPTPTPAPSASPIIHSVPPPTPQLPPPPPASRATHKRPTPPAPTRTNQRDRKPTKRKQEADAGARFMTTNSHTPSFDPPTNLPILTKHYPALMPTFGKPQTTVK